MEVKDVGSGAADDSDGDGGGDDGKDKVLSLVFTPKADVEEGLKALEAYYVPSVFELVVRFLRRGHAKAKLAK